MKSATPIKRTVPRLSDRDDAAELLNSLYKSFDISFSTSHEKESPKKVEKKGIGKKVSFPNVSVQKSDDDVMYTGSFNAHVRASSKRKLVN